jgi:hypothetical protein
MPYNTDIEGAEAPGRQRQETNQMNAITAKDIAPTAIAQYAAAQGATAADRPAYASSANGMAFAVGLWARERGVAVYKVHKSSGYTYILNDTYTIKL